MGIFTKRDHEKVIPLIAQMYSHSLDKFIANESRAFTLIKWFLKSVETRDAVS
jgi:hypothetical protein